MRNIYYIVTTANFWLLFLFGIENKQFYISLSNRHRNRYPQPPPHPTNSLSTHHNYEEDNRGKSGQDKD